MKLRGFAVGNGLTMPEIQYGAYADYARGMDVVDEAAAAAAARVYPACAAKIRKCGGGAGPEGPAAVRLGLLFSFFQFFFFLNLFPFLFFTFFFTRECPTDLCADDPYAAESKKRAAACVDAFNFCDAIPGGILEAAGNINVYDVRKKCVGSLCYDFSAAEKFLNLPAVRAALGVGDRAWAMCSAKVRTRARVHSCDSDVSAD